MEEMQALAAEMKFEEAQKKQELMFKELFKNGVISAARLKTMQDCSELREIDRYTLCSMVKKISVYENHRIEIEFYYTDQYRIMREVNKRIDSVRKEEQEKFNRGTPIPPNGGKPTTDSYDPAFQKLLDEKKKTSNNARDYYLGKGE